MIRFFVPCILAASAFGATPEEILATFELHPEFQLELVAMEPLVFDPVDMEWDEQGRAFVLEMPGYPFGDTPGQVVQLEDEDHDGRYERRTVFAEGFPVAVSILPWEGGLLVASPPELVFVKDTDGDGKADVREVLLAGFDFGNTQHNFNGLTHGLDNWIYAASGGNGGEVYWPGKPEAVTPLRWNDFRMDLRQHLFERIGRSTGGFGLALDPYGRFFGTHNMVHASHLVFPGAYLDPIAGINQDTLHNVSDHEESGTARVFPLGEQETRVNHPEQSGYFSGACGITMYNGGAFGPEFEGNLFVNDVVVNLLHRDVLRPSGATFSASRARERVEFLASHDRGFRPVNGAVGPEGAYYLLDMHRSVIEHPEWIPDELEKDMDIKAGMGEGRIFRITPKGGLPWVQPGFSRAQLPEVVQALEHKNKWWRDTAQRLLVEWQAQEAAPLLEALLSESESPLARVHALWTLQGLGRLENPLLLVALQDSEAGVRENALMIAEHRLDAGEIAAQVLKLAGDPDARVRMFVALALTRLQPPADGEDQRVAALEQILQQDIEDEYVRRAVLAVSAQSPRVVLVAVLENDALLQRPGAAPLVETLADFLGRGAGAGDVAAALAALAGVGEDLQPAVIAGLANGMSTRAEVVSAWQEVEALRAEVERLLASESLPVVREAWRLGNLIHLAPGEHQQALMAQAREGVLDVNASKEQRLEYLALLELAPFEEREALLFDLLHSRHPREVQTAAIAQLTQAGTPEVAERLISEWKRLSAPVRAQTGTMLLRRREHHGRLLDALESGAIGLGEMNFDLERRRVLLHRSTDEVKQRAEKLFNDAGVVTREAALEKMRPALKLEGDPERGRQVFAENCAKCHIISGEGFNVGPDLTDIFRKSRETLLHDILDPNAAVDTEFISFTIETAAEDVFDQQVLTGMIVSETDDEVVLREAGGIDHTIPREKIANISSTGLSMMPEELEAGFSVEQVADLLSFLQQTR